MIDCEPEIFTMIATTLREKFPGITVYGETVLSPSEFPCACIEEADNYSYIPTRDTGSNENHAVIVHEVNVFSNKAVGKKTECKKIFETITDIYIGLGFTRSTRKPINLGDAAKYRLFGRFTAVISEDNVIYRR